MGDDDGLLVLGLLLGAAAGAVAAAALLTRRGATAAPGAPPIELQPRSADLAEARRVASATVTRLRAAFPDLTRD